MTAQIGKSIDLLNLLVADVYGYSSAGIPDAHGLGFRIIDPEPDLC